MLKCKGSSVMAGVAIAPLHFYQRPARCYDMSPCKDPAAEVARMEQARQQAIRHQSVLYEKALQEAGAEIAAVFDVHALMLDDNEFVETVRENINSLHMRAEYAVRCAAYAMVDRFAEVDDEYMRARIDDILDIGRGLIYQMQGGVLEEDAWDGPAIIVAEELSPSEAVQMNKEQVVGIVTRVGSSISHTSILARSMELPALVNAKDVKQCWEGHMAILDGLSGELLIDPDVDTLIKYRQIQQEFIHRKKLLHRLKGRPNETIDGHLVQVLANIGQAEDLEAAKENDAGGVGQFRSDYLFLGPDPDPDEDTQYRCYKEAARAVSPCPMQVVTEDWSSSTPSSFMNLTREESIALTRRGIRRSLMEPESFRVQIRALLRAAVVGNVRIMLPMVTSVKQVQWAKQVIEDCKNELLEAGVPVGEAQLGILVETPAAVWIADELAQEADFFMIGTNDLIQFTCVLDRDGIEGVPFADPYHPAILRQIDYAIQAAHRHGIPVGISGEMGGDIALTEHLLRLGIDAFSVNPTMILPLRNRIRHLDLREEPSPLPDASAVVL